MLPLIIRLVASLAVVVGLLLLLARFGARKFRGNSGALVHVVHRQPLTRTSSVAVVTVGSRVLVLGTTEQQINVLTELDAGELDLDDLDGIGDLSDADVVAIGSADWGSNGLMSVPDLSREDEPAVSIEPTPYAATHARALDELDAAPLVVATTVTTAATASAGRRTAGRPAKGAHRPEPAVAARASATGSHRAAGRSHRAPSARTSTSTTPATESAQLPPAASGPLAGSILSPQTWRQAFSVATNRGAARRAS